MFTTIRTSRLVTLLYTAVYIHTRHAYIVALERGKRFFSAVMFTFCATESYFRHTIRPSVVYFSATERLLFYSRGTQAVQYTICRRCVTEKIEPVEHKDRILRSVALANRATTVRITVWRAANVTFQSKHFSAIAS